MLFFSARWPAHSKAAFGSGLPAVRVGFVVSAAWSREPGRVTLFPLLEVAPLGVERARQAINGAKCTVSAKN